MRRFFAIFSILVLTFFLTACTKEKQTVEDFYAQMLEIRMNSGDGRIYSVAVFNGQEIVNYKIWTKNQKVRVETIDVESYSNYNTLFVDNGVSAYKYNPYTREAQVVLGEKEKRIYNPMQFLVNWGKNDAGYLNNLYRFGRDTKIENIPCKIIRNIDPMTKREGFSYCVSPKYGVAVYFEIPKVEVEGSKKSEKITWVKKIEEENLEDYLFELPDGANVAK